MEKSKCDIFIRCSFEIELYFDNFFFRKYSAQLVLKEVFYKVSSERDVVYLSSRLDQLLLHKCREDFLLYRSGY